MRQTEAEIVCFVCGEKFYTCAGNVKYCPRCREMIKRESHCLSPDQQIDKVREKLGIGTTENRTKKLRRQAPQCWGCLARDTRLTDRIVCAFGRCAKARLDF